MIVYTKEQFDEAITWLQSVEVVAYDIETNGTNPRTDKIYGFGISDSETSYYFPWLVWDAETNTEKSFNSEWSIGKILNILATKKLVCHNAAFDIPFTEKYFAIDLLPALYVDTMLLKHTVDEEFPFGLKQIAAKLWGESEKDAQDAMKASAKANGGGPTDYYKASLEVLAKYCEQDCKLTYRIMQHYLPILEREGLHDFYFNKEVMPLYKEVTIPMEQNGIRLDMALLLKTRHEIVADIKAIDFDIQAAISPHLAEFKEWFLNKDFPPSRSGAFAQGIAEYFELPLPRTKSGNYSLTAKAIDALSDSHAKRVLQKTEYLTKEETVFIQELLWTKVSDGSLMFNLSSKHHLKKLFFDKLKETPLSRTEKGSPQVDDEFLQKMAEKYSWAADLITYNKLMKIKGTYVDRFIDEAEDGRFYPSFQQHRTISGRYAGDLQQLPRPIEPGGAPEVVIKYNNRIREFFIADDGYIFVDDDYESAEPRTFAHVSGDPAIKKIFEGGEDFYSSIAILVEGLTGVSADKTAPNYLGKISKSKRQAAKAYALGIPYGMSGYKLSFELGISVEEAERLVEKYLRAFPQLRQWMQDTALKVRSQGKVRAETGRVRHMPRAPELYRVHGDALLNSLDLWKKYGKDAKQYAHAKELRKEFRNYLANGNNFQIQSRVASTINLACIAMVRKFEELNLPAKLIAQMHDEVIVHCQEAHKEKVGAIVRECMETAAPISVPMIAIPSYGKNFREAKG